MRSGRILALDYGSKNVGLATCDELGTIALPLPSVPNLNRWDLLRRLKAVINELAIESLVVGLPFNMDGSSGDSVRRVERFMGQLRRVTDLPIIGVDERLSTAEAAEMWLAMSARRQRRYRTVDSFAAALILERFLGES